MPESGSTIPLVNVTTSGGYGAAIPAFTVSTSAGAFTGVPAITVTTSGGYGAAISTVVVTTSAGAFTGVPLVTVTTSGGAFGGVPLVGVSSSSLTPVTIVTSSGAMVPATTGAGLLVSSTQPVPISGIPTVAVTTSGGVFAGVPTVQVTTSGGWGSAQSVTSTSVRLTESGAITPKLNQATSVSKVSSSAGVLWSLYAFTTGISGAVLRLYNASTSNVLMGASVAAYVNVGYQSSALASVNSLQRYAPWGMNFATACSFDVVLNATSTLAVAGQAFVTSLFR